MKNTVLIIHEVSGVTENLRSLSSILELKGYKVILPSLYSDNYIGTNEEYSYKKFFTEVGFEKAFYLINRIIEENRRENIFIIGFSVGATLAWMKSTDNRIRKVIGYYGSRIRYHLDICPSVPSRLFFCNEESFDVDNLIKKLEEKSNVEVGRIIGDHGFYSRDRFESVQIQETNKRIFQELNSV
jgi:dienelactone hydrolase